MTKHWSVWQYVLLAISLIIVIIGGQGKLIAQVDNPVGNSTTSAIAQCESAAENYGACLTQEGYNYLNRGDAQAALEIWQKAEAAYPENSDGFIGSQINQGMALQGLGQSRQACQVLVKALYGDRLYSICDVTSEETLDLSAIDPSLVNEIRPIALRNLGEVLRAIGKLDQSQQVLEKSLEISQKLNISEQINLVQLELGNTHRANYYRLTNLYERTDNKANTRKDAIAQADLALASYRQVRQTYPLLQIKSQLNQLSLLVDFKDWLSKIKQSDSFTHKSEITDLIDLLNNSSTLTNLPPSKFAVDAQINFALNLSKLGESKMAFTYAEKAKEIATSLGNPSTESYALGVLGELFYARYLDLKQDEDLTQAETLTKEAIATANKIPDSANLLYEWQWHLGKIYQDRGNIEEAIAAYDKAVEYLEIVRQGLVSIDRDVQFSFRDNVEPIYREFIDLLLRSENPSTENLDKAIKAADSIQLAELENFIQCDRESLKLKPISEFNNPPAAIIYPIVLRDRLEVIVKRDKKNIYAFKSQIKEEDIKKTVYDLQQSLADKNSRKESIAKKAQKLYNWLIRPAEDILPESGTLVFVLDSLLQKIPMAVLHDGQHYLIEKYSLAVSSGEQIPEPKDKVKRQALLLGVSEKAPIFPDNLPALSGVIREFSKIQNFLGNYQQLINKNFTLPNLENKVKNIPFSEILFATHGQFSSDPKETFIYAWDHKITVQELEKLLQLRGKISTEPLQLLVLSACETAKGDPRAVLGIAGIGLKANARSVVASLWQVDDDATTQFMGEFYRQLHELNKPKAEAIRQAQLPFLKDERNAHLYAHPFYWSAFILAGNWDK